LNDDVAAGSTTHRTPSLSSKTMNTFTPKRQMALQDNEDTKRFVRDKCRYLTTVGSLEAAKDALFIYGDSDRGNLLVLRHEHTCSKSQYEKLRKFALIHFYCTPIVDGFVVHERRQPAPAPALPVPDAVASSSSSSAPENEKQ